MAEHPAVVFLTAALARAEETAKAATPGPWAARTEDQDDEVCTVLGGDLGHDLVGYPVAYVRAECPRCDCLRLDEDRTRANMRLITSHASPEMVLRLAAGAREILAEHALELRKRPTFVLNDGPMSCCKACWGELYPCRTVLLLAQAWGWTEEG